jgi:polar amino acid transport system permease protein
VQPVIDNSHLLWRGIIVTLQLSGLVILIGSLLGLFGGVGLLYGKLPIRFLLRVYVDVARGTPLLVLIFLGFYGLPAAGVSISGFQSATLALSLFAGAHMSEVFRGAVSGVPVGQIDAAKSLGVTFWPRLRYVVLPQSLPAILPPWVNTAVEMVKGTSLVALVGVGDLLRSTQQVMERTGDVIPLYLSAAVAYIVINFSISMFGTWLEQRFKFMAVG